MSQPLQKESIVMKFFITTLTALVLCLSFSSFSQTIKIVDENGREIPTSKEQIKQRLNERKNASAKKIAERQKAAQEKIDAVREAVKDPGKQIKEETKKEIAERKKNLQEKAQKAAQKRQEKNIKKANEHLNKIGLQLKK